MALDSEFAMPQISSFPCLRERWRNQAMDADTSSEITLYTLGRLCFFKGGATREP